MTDTPTTHERNSAAGGRARARTRSDETTDQHQRQRQHEHEHEHEHDETAESQDERHHCPECGGELIEDERRGGRHRRTDPRVAFASRSTSVSAGGVPTRPRALYV